MAVETSQSILAWGDETFGPITDADAFVRRITDELVELAEAVRAGDQAEVGAEAADVAILLHRLLGPYRLDLNAEIDRKMSINRARVWKTDGKGAGSHV